jgi:hypothetical protein
MKNQLAPLELNAMRSWRNQSATMRNATSSSSTISSFAARIPPTVDQFDRGGAAIGDAGLADPHLIGAVIGGRAALGEGGFAPLGVPAPRPAAALDPTALVSHRPEVNELAFRVPEPFGIPEPGSLGLLAAALAIAAYPARRHRSNSTSGG